VASITAEQREAGVVAFSSGNHAQGVALACNLLAVDAVIVMPSDAPPNKLAATRGYGADVVIYDRYTESREEIGAELSDRQGRFLIKPYDHPAVMAGQGTAGLELLDDHPDLDTLVVCLGGGGLLSGCATIAADIAPGIELYGVEPEAGDDHRRSRSEGQRVTIAVPVTIADGQQTTAPGELTWPITDALVTDFLAVTDDEIVNAMAHLLSIHKTVAEPSGASALAAVLAGRVPVEGRTVGVTISGGNIDLQRLVSLVGSVTSTGGP
jgi:threonine dehydratase